MKALESQTLDGLERYRLRFGSGQRVGRRYVNIVVISVGGRLADRRTCQVLVARQSFAVITSDPLNHRH